MKLSYKIALTTVLLSLALAFGLSVGSGEKNWFLIIFGAICFLAGIAMLLLAGVLHLAKRREWSKGFLVSSGILFLLGLGVCGPLWMGIWRLT
jgi:hypothetical protein